MEPIIIKSWFKLKVRPHDPDDPELPILYISRTAMVSELIGCTYLFCLHVNTFFYFL